MRGYVDGPFGQVHYERHGDGIPIVLLHQAPTASVQFVNVFAPLMARGLQPIAVDTPGFGMSDGPPYVPEIEDYAVAVMAVLDGLDMSSVHLAGHHTGAQTATEVALRLPTRIRSLSLHSPFFLTDVENKEFSSQMLPFEMNQQVRHDGSHLTDSWAYRAQYAPGFDPEIMHRHVVQQLMHMKTGWHGHNACYRYPHAKKMLEVRQPCQVLTNKGDLLYPFAKRIADIRADIPIVEFEGGTIDFIDEFPGVWSTAVANFVLGFER